MALIPELAIFLILYYQETKKNVSKGGYLMQIKKTLLPILAFQKKFGLLG